MRMVLAFFTACSVNTVLHECAHALAAYSLGLRATLFHWYVNIDYPRGDATARVLCATSGPLLSLAVGIVCWVLYKRFQTGPAALLLLYASILGMSMFLGNVFSTSLVDGDFGAVARELQLAPVVTISFTVAGGVLLAGFLYRTAPELLKWTHAEGTALAVVVEVIVWPVALGTALVTLSFLPVPALVIQDRIASSLFWAFAAAGVVRAHRRDESVKGRNLPVQTVDLAVAVAALVAVRFLAQGIRLGA
jgi:hypothetical protein